MKKSKADKSIIKKKLKSIRLKETIILKTRVFSKLLSNILKPLNYIIKRQVITQIELYVTYNKINIIYAFKTVTLLLELTLDTLKPIEEKDWVINNKEYSIRLFTILSKAWQ